MGVPKNLELRIFQGIFWFNGRLALNGGVEISLIFIDLLIGKLWHKQSTFFFNSKFQKLLGIETSKIICEFSKIMYKSSKNDPFSILRNRYESGIIFKEFKQLKLIILSYIYFILDFGNNTQILSITCFWHLITYYMNWSGPNKTEWFI